MKRLMAVAVGGIFSALVIAAAYAAPAPVPQGIVNARKAMQSKLERDKKVSEARKQGQLRKKQAQRAK